MNPRMDSIMDSMAHDAMAHDAKTHDRTGRFLRTLGLSLFCAALACGRGKVAPGPPPPPAPVSVTVRPAAVAMLEGGTQQFDATVANANDLALTWSVDEGAPGGRVDPGGHYTAPGQPGVFHVRATSHADEAKSDAAAVTVAAPGTLPAIGSFTGTPSSIHAGESATLTWSVAGADSLVIDQGIGAVTGSSVVVKPSANITYRLTAQDAQGSVSATTSVAVGPASPGPPGTPSCPVFFRVDSTQATHAISRYIYGYNAGSPSAAPPGATLLRIGGNRLTAYNWETNASNAGSDYLYENDAFLTSSTVPGEVNRPTIAADTAAGLATLITIPIQGYVASDENSQQDQNQPIVNHFFQSLPRKGSAFTLTPNLTDHFVYQDEYVNCLLHQFPGAAASASSPVLFELDNEPDLWGSTHAEIERSPVTYAELLQKTKDAAAAIKDVAPGGLLYGPVSYGFEGFFSLQSAVSGATADGADWFLDHYLRDLKAAGDAQGRRLLDVLDLHWYTEATGNNVRVNAGNDNTPLVQAARVQAPRSLWDPAYIETSWITQYVLNDGIRLIPRLRKKIADGYPGTLLAFTEYNHGGSDDITGAVAQADTLGIFGREGVHAAAFWPLLSNNSFVYGAWSMFRDYDQHGGAFGDTSLQALSDDDSQASIYASVDAGHPERVVLVAVNKATVSHCAGLQLVHSIALHTAHVFQLTAASPLVSGAVVPKTLADVAVTANALDVDMPAWSVTTLVLVP